MDFDIDSAIGGMSDAMQGSLGEGAGEIASFALTALSKQKDALAELADALRTGDISRQDFEEEMQRQMLIVETELLTVTVIGKAAIQKAINAAISAVTSMVKPI